MNIKEITIHPSAQLRMHILRSTLIKYGHHFINDINQADLIFLDCMRVCDIPNNVIDIILKFNNQIVLTSLGDWLTFNISMEEKSLPEKLVDKANGFVKLNWHPNSNMYIPQIRGKQITIQPFLISGIPTPITNKKNTISFFGLPTGDLRSENNLRIRSCRLLKNKSYFCGGIVGQEPNCQSRDISGIEVGFRNRPFYLQTINQSLLSLCLPGNSILSYRLFESLGMKSCVVACGLDDIKWLNKLTPGEHYLKVKFDLSNLTGVCEWALDNIGTVKQIAENGYKIYQEYYKLNEDGSITENLWYDIKEQFNNLGIGL